MKKKYLFILILMFLLGVPSSNVDAIAALNCEYEGVLNTFCGDGSDGSDCKVKINIKIEKTKWVTPTLTLLTTYADVDGCRAGDSVSDCMNYINTNGLVEANKFYSVDRNVKVIKSDNNYYNIVTEDYTTYFLNDEKKYFQCPAEINVLRNEDTNGLAIFVSNETFNETYCKDGGGSGKQIGEFGCEKTQSLRDTFTLSKQVSAMPYFGGEIDSGNSSGSCCVYSFGGDTTKIYTYLITSASGANSYGVCSGANDDCITAEPNLSTKAGYMSLSDNQLWANYHNLSDCSNMPENIWFSRVDGRIKFFPYHASYSDAGNNAVMQATLQPDVYCKSDVYEYGYGSGDITDSTTNPDSEIDWGDRTDVNCDGIIGQEMLDFLNKIFRWIQIFAPIIVIILGSVEFAGAVIQDDKDALKKAMNKFIKRLIIAVAIFFIPLIISWLLEIFNDVTGAASGTCGIGGK